MIARLIGFVVLLWGLGFAAFMLFLARPSDVARTDAIVVPTGGAGRIARGLTLIEEKRADRMLVSGVAPGLRKADLAEAFGHADAIACCVDLGRQAVDTRSNAEETAAWVREHHYRSVRLVTSDWHMARARMELHAALDDGVAIVRDGVPTQPKLRQLVNEYNKLLLRRIVLWLGLGK
ncbi:MAG: YdcF family protein [Sphingomonas bacterium]